MRILIKKVGKEWVVNEKSFEQLNDFEVKFFKGFLEAITPKSTDENNPKNYIGEKL